MQKKQQVVSNSQSIMAIILKSIPKEANVTRIDYEGPRIALYTKTPKFLMENNTLIASLVNEIKKRIVVRTDESIRKNVEDAKKILDQNVPKEASLQGIFFDTTTGEVSIEVKRPWLCQRNVEEFNHAEMAEKTGWKIRVRKSTTKPSSTIQSINYQLKISAAERAKHLKQVGEQIFRSRLVQKSEVSLLTLGGFGQVGRSCMLLTTPDSKILIDCGAVSYTHLTLPTKA